MTGYDPDDLPPAPPAHALVDLGFKDGLLFHHLSLAGLAGAVVDPAKEGQLVVDWALVAYLALGDPDFT